MFQIISKFLNLKIFLIIIILIVPDLSATSLVYNMKIRRIFNVSAFLGKEPKSTVLLSIVPIIYKRDRHIVNNDLAPLDICEKRISSGSLLNLRYVPSQNWWAEVTTLYFQQAIIGSLMKNRRLFYMGLEVCPQNVQ